MSRKKIPEKVQQVIL